jgi:hypothetical protein
MKAATWFLAGVGVALVVLAPHEASCCRRVSANARAKAQGALGGWIGPVGDVLGVWTAVPGLLDFLGLPDDT